MSAFAPGPEAECNERPDRIGMFKVRWVLVPDLYRLAEVRV